LPYARKFAAAIKEPAVFASGAKNFCAKSDSLVTWTMVLAGPQRNTPTVAPVDVPTAGTDVVRSISEVLTPGETKNAMGLLLSGRIEILRFI
jgi:hypothetical protein